MPIPSVVIEPASSNEGDDDRDADIISPTAVDDATATPQSCGLKHISPSGGGSGFPDDFLYKAGLVKLTCYCFYPFGFKLFLRYCFHASGGDLA